MDKLEDFLMRVARIFGLVVMAITLSFAGIFVIVIAYRGTVAMFRQTHPKVEFYPADFKTQSVPTDSIELAADDTDGQMSAMVLEEIMPAYKTETEKYLNKKADDLGLKEQADRQKALEDRVKAFRTSSDASLRQTFGLIRADEKKNFANGLADYMEDAQKGGIEPYSDGGAPISNIYYSAAFQKFVQKFNAQLVNLRKDDDDSVTAMLGRAATYLGLVGCIMVFLLQALMFAILRIEKKMKT